MGKFLNIQSLALAPIMLAAALGAQAAPGMSTLMSEWGGGTSGPVAQTGNTSSPTNWRLTAGMSFNGVQGAFDGTALLLFTTSTASGTYACSGSLVSSQYVLTAGHCTDGLLSMSIQFGYTNGVALQTRLAAGVVQAPGWNGTLDTGADLALVKLDAPVTNLPIYALSTTNDVGKQFVMTGYGSSGNGASAGSSGNPLPNWNDGAYGHYGYNVFDTTSDVFTAAWDAKTGEGVYTAPTYGLTYVADFDYYNATPNATNSARYNTLQRIADVTGGGWTSNQGLGAGEALIGGGDSGGGDFVWNGSQWVLSAVHSWGWQFCGGRFGSGTPGGGANCDLSANNSSSFGDLMGSTAVFSHAEWINSVIGATPVPEPESYALLLAGLGVVAGVARRRRRAA